MASFLSLPLSAFSFSVLTPYSQYLSSKQHQRGSRGWAVGAECDQIGQVTDKLCIAQLPQENEELAIPSEYSLEGSG
jgi:hypothetical protein